MTQKFKVGEGVICKIRYNGRTLTYDGTIANYSDEEEMYWINLGYESQRAPVTFMPSGLLSRVYMSPMNGTWHIFRGPRGLEAKIYSDGLDNWV